MGEESISRWKKAFDDLVLEIEETSGPDDDEATWFEAMARFARHSFARLLLSPGDDLLRLRLEAAFGPVDENPQDVATALAERLGKISQTKWSVASDEIPWILTATIGDDEDGEQGVDHLRRLLLDLLKITDSFGEVTSSSQWLSILREPLSGEDKDAAVARSNTEPSGASSPFEEIGAGAAAQDDATIEAFLVRKRKDSLLVALGFAQVLAPRQIDALEMGLESHLHTKFDVQVRPLDADDRGDVDFPASARTILTLEISVGGYPSGLSSLQDEVESFLERLEKFSSYGVDLFEYLGVGDTVLEDAHQARAYRDRPSPSEDEAESVMSFSHSRLQRPADRDAVDEAPGAVVLDLAAGAGVSSGDSLEPGNYTDPRIQRDDAQTPLVDLVLRHPGYSDRRIGQVLSILLSIEYHDALVIADSAPCVLAWGLGQQRARSFKEVIESAGGKALLVEPGTFGER